MRRVPCGTQSLRDDGGRVREERGRQSGLDRGSGVCTRRGHCRHPDSNASAFNLDWTSLLFAFGAKDSRHQQTVCSGPGLAVAVPSAAGWSQPCWI